MRIATFNVESLETLSRTGVRLEERVAILRPQLERLRADVLCLQEVNGERLPGEKTRTLAALAKLLEGTRYERFARIATGTSSSGAADVHNLVILSHFKVIAHREIRHTILPPVDYRLISTGVPDQPPQPVHFDRPVLAADLQLENGRTLSVFNVHFRAPLAVHIEGQKEAPFVWKSVKGWAEGFYLAALKRAGQALELRLAIDALMDADPDRMIAVCGDFNAEDHETPLKIVVAAEEDTGNGLLAGRSMIVLDRSLSHDRRFSVLHHGRAQMLDHILVSRSLLASFRSIEAHNEALEDEISGAATVQHPVSSYHAPVVAEFSLG